MALGKSTCSNLVDRHSFVLARVSFTVLSILMWIIWGVSSGNTGCGFTGFGVDIVRGTFSV
jgi:hypothetical protein